MYSTDTADISSHDSARLTAEPEVSVVMPCLNEEQTIGRCIEKALAAFSEYGLRGEIVVADNGSTDASTEICLRYGVRVVHQPRRGYGNACLKGVEAARGKYIVMADADDTYDLREIPLFIDLLRQGFELVMGNRFKGKVLPGAMTWSHRYIGNPVLSGVLRLMFATGVGDVHSGIRALTREAAMKLGLRAPGMEFASEMVINAAKLRMRVAEVPVTYYPRLGSSKLRTMRDGWRHLRYMLLRSPTHLFVLPGFALLVLGMVALTPFLSGPVTIGGRSFDIHLMFLVGMCALVGYQLLTLGAYARILAVREGVDVEDRLLGWIRQTYRLELGILAGVLLLIAGTVSGALVLSKWLSSGLGALSLADTRLAFFGLIVLVLGVQTVFSSFYLLIVLGLNCEDDNSQAKTPSHDRRV